MRTLFIFIVLYFLFLSRGFSQPAQNFKALFEKEYSIPLYKEQPVIDSLIKVEVAKSRSESPYFMLYIYKFYNTYKFHVYRIETKQNELILHPFFENYDIKIWGYCRYLNYTILLSNNSDDPHKFFDKSDLYKTFKFGWFYYDGRVKKFATLYSFKDGVFVESGVGSQ